MPLISGKTYKIVNFQTNKLLDHPGAQQPVGVSAPSGGPVDAQKWLVTLRTGTQNTWFLKNVATGRYLGVQGDVPLNDNFPQSIAEGLARFDNVHVVGLEAQGPGWFIPPMNQVAPNAYKIHYIDPAHPDKVFELENLGKLDITDVSDPTSQFHLTNRAVQLFYDSSTPTQVWSLDVV